MKIDIVTANLDFTNRPRETKIDLEKILSRSVEVIMFQEGKNADVNALIVDPKWAVVQNLNDEAKQGTGIAWKRVGIRKARAGYKVGTAPKGARMLIRYITWANLVITQNNKTRRVKFVAVHLPPKRYAWLQWPMLLALLALIRATRLPVIVGGDWNLLVNSSPKLARFERLAKGKFYGRGIDGFLLVNKRHRWRITNIRTVKTNSDHDAVIGTLSHP